MTRISIKPFSEEAISDFIIPIIEELSDYEYAKYIKHSIDGSAKTSLDIVVVLEQNYNKISALYDILNYKISTNNKIETFFRGTDKRSFLFPAGVNVYFVNLEEFRTKISKWNLISSVAESTFSSLIEEHLQSNIAQLLILEVKEYNIDRAIEETFKPFEAKQLSG
jgi:alpha-D-ribose 1-methylphosphonate 5-phosphate C-P lyase